MARDFNGGLTDYITPQDTYGNFPSLAAFIELDAVGSVQETICGKWAGTFNGLCVLLEVSAAGKPSFYVNIPPIYGVIGATTLSTGTRYHMCGVYNGPTLDIYLDGVLDGSAAGSPFSFTPTLGGAYRIGYRDSAGGFGFDGRIAEVGFWNRPLRAEEAEALAGGVSPARIPWGLISYCPLWGLSDPEEDLVQGVPAVITGTVPAADTPIGAGSPWSTAG